MGEDAIACEECGAEFKQETQALNMITPDLYSAFNLKPTSNVSANPYDATCIEIIRSVASKGGMVLDCGAGFRADFNPNVINSEIVDYPTTDILAVGQTLPFKSDSFDAVLSQAVLEHVSDPFACANEITRVTRPGGTIFCVVPLNQPEHGYPNHFYNMTRQGLRNLFGDGIEIEKQFVPDRGQPIFSLRWFLEIYCDGLPPQVREKFESMSVREILDHNIGDRDLAGVFDYIQELEEEVRWRLASTTGLLARKKG